MMITACGSNQNDASVTTSAKMAGTTTAVTAGTVQDVTSDVQELTAAQTTQAQDTTWIQCKIKCGSVKRRFRLFYCIPVMLDKRQCI